MASLVESIKEKEFLSEKFENIPKFWDGKLCIQEMKNAGNTDWRQMEWIGFYPEFKIRNILVSQNKIKPKGETFGKVTFDLGGLINWDIKSHPNSSKSAILNDLDATNLSIDKNNYHGLIILCVDCEFDESGDFKKWHDLLKGGKSQYENQRIARGAPSRKRKISAQVTDIKFILLDKKNIHCLGRAQEGWRNSDGGSRKVKYSISHDQINELSI